MMLRREYGTGYSGRTFPGEERWSPLPLWDVNVPGPWWNSLTYEFTEHAEPGGRALVPVGKGFRHGIIERGPVGRPTGEGFTIRQARAVSDAEPLLLQTMLQLVSWAGKTFLCGPGETLKTAVPASILSFPEPFPSFSGNPGRKIQGIYEEVFLYECRTRKRWIQFIERIENAEPFLVLFPEHEMASSFFDLLPTILKERTILWPSGGGKKLHNSWLTARAGGISGIVGGPGAVFAPLPFLSSVIVDEESSGAFRSYNKPFINARTIAGRRALLEKSSLTLAGRLPSSRVYLRGRPVCTTAAPRHSVRYVDIRKGFASETPGVEGNLRLSEALLAETKNALVRGKTALWLLDRKGYAGEVACEDCGNSVRCPRCSGIMAWEEKKGRLRCSSCGTSKPIPEFCPICRGTLLTGKRPGLEALFPVARAIAQEGIPVMLWNEARTTGKKNRLALKKELATGGIVLGTRAALALCDMAEIGLAAWIDADGETRSVSYQAKFNAFSMAWESFWRGNEGTDRVVLLQSRRPGTSWQRGMVSGWEKFWEDELAERKELGLPPYAFLVEISARSAEQKESIMSKLEESGFLPMDPGTPPLIFWVAAESLSRVHGVLAPFFSIGNSRKGFPEIKVWID